MTTVNDSQVMELLKELYRRMDGDLRPVSSEIGEIAVSSIQKNFEDGGRPSRWADLSDVTKEQRRRINKYPGQILVRKGVSGGLMGSVNYRPLKSGVVISANKKYARLHQEGAAKGAFGTVLAQVPEHTRTRGTTRYQVRAHSRRMKIPWGDIPPRPFMLLQEEDWREIRDVLNDYLVRLG